jgi:uncharacterized protein
MFIDIHELELNPLDFDEEFQPEAVELVPDVRLNAVLKGSGRAQLVSERHGKHEKLLDIRLNGKFSTSVETICARCLEPVVTAVGHDFDLLYRPQGADAGKEEMSVTDAEAEISYYQGDGLELVDVLREQILLALPLKMICREDCKGLCPMCGRNWNQGSCDCKAKAEDARWAALKDIRKQLEH